MGRTFLASGLLLMLTAFVFAAQAEDQNALPQTQNANDDQTSGFTPEDWSFHAQATEIYQGYPSFHSPYSGTNSLPSQDEWKNTTTATLFLGARLWEGAALYYDPELYQGVALDHTLGIAGFPNGEGSKAGSYQVDVGSARLFVRQVFGFGGPTENIDADQNQMADTEDVSRLTLTAGKFAVTDMFDNNSYSHDARTQFLNWSLIDSAAWDYPADSRGYTNGVVADFNQEGWALRYGIFMEPENPNESDLGFHGAENFGQAAELEERYQIDRQPGKARFLAFLNINRAAYYSAALDQSGNVTTALDDARQYGTPKYGAALNLEQQVNDDFGAFLRLSWNDGHTEDWTFTQIDRSAALGVSLKGTSWDRPDDVLGIAGALNGLSADQEKFLERGGYGFLIGDGQLSYAPETIFETYYALKITGFAFLSPDYQFIANPGYNSARGPVNIFAVRLHFEI